MVRMRSPVQARQVAYQEVSDDTSFLFARYIIYDILGNRKRAISCEIAPSESLIFLSSIRLRCLVISLFRLDLQVAQVG